MGNCQVDCGGSIFGAGTFEATFPMGSIPDAHLVGVVFRAQPLDDGVAASAQGGWGLVMHEGWVPFGDELGVGCAEDVYSGDDLTPLAEGAL